MKDKEIFLAVVGRTGSGKSSVANTILGETAFSYEDGFYPITYATEMESTTLKDGRRVHVIDTPGLNVFTTSSEFVGREIVKCIDLARDGLHAVLMVFSIIDRFSMEEEVAIQNLNTFFGDRIFDYVIVVLTGVDRLDSSKFRNDVIEECPELLKNFIFKCKNRVVAFNNITKDEVQRERQVKQLISLINSLVAGNRGKTFTSQMLAQAKEGTLCRQQMKKENKPKGECSTKDLSKRKEEHDKSYDDEFKSISEMTYHNLYGKIEKLEKNLAEEKASRLKLEKDIEILRLEDPIAESRAGVASQRSEMCCVIA